MLRAKELFCAFRLIQQFIGYAMASGDLNGDKVSDVAIGTPKGHNLTGMVSLDEVCERRNKADCPFSTK